MKDSLSTKLHLREVADRSARLKSYRKLYSDPSLIRDLDIVNELDGHSGCVNALAWSKSGNLLASGSDDQHLNIHTYQPSDESCQFKLATTVATGHTQNIFSVKFMPHSNDSTVITASGDGQVRVFDTEYAGQASEASRASTLASEGRRRRRNIIYNGVRYLSDGNTNARVYRSHGDRVKRIVTESSPHLFLTCGEDGDVRQWDCRQPSSAYPAPRGGRFSSESNVPPPLISYRRYGLDLNTVSCSASQPHYIALGGAHLHAFLHDRRMTGRDRLEEMGKPLRPINQLSTEDQELLGQATQCVRKFAPQGQRRMKRTDNGHITACKISDARPDEMIVSWSGDHIYSFDLVRDDDDQNADSIGILQARKAKEGKDRKRKRKAGGSEASLANEGTANKRTEDSSANDGGTSLRIRYQNGQTEDVPLQSHVQRQTPPTDRQQKAQHLAKSIVRIQSSLFGSSGEASQYSGALGICATVLTDTDDIMREWGYPIEPTPEEVYLQKRFRHTRESARRFVQAAGTLARVLGGQLRTVSGPSPMMANFTFVEVRRSDLELSKRERFSYDFLKAILLWLDSGIGRLIEGFTRQAGMPETSKAASRLPIPEEDATTEAVDEYLIPYLLQLASESRIVDVGINRFVADDDRTVFADEKQAVLAFAAAVRVPFADLSSAIVLADQQIHAQDRQTALRFWALKVARGLLLNATVFLDFVSVDSAFGGLGVEVREVVREEARLNLLRHGSDEDESEENEFMVSAVEFMRDGTEIDRATSEDMSITQTGDQNQEMHDNNEDDNAIESGDDEDDVDIIVEEDSEDDYSESSSEVDEEDGVPNLGITNRYVYRTAFQRRSLRPRVEPNVMCSKPTRQFRGHCNVRTVKDVNYFGMDDEYVVSGSDDGMVFIWDRKTAELVNILEGDGEVVNVIQGHPYETVLAVSGIDHTIKIFSPDARARQVARLGHEVSAHDPSSFSSLAWPPRSGRRRREQESEPTQNGQTTTSESASPRAGVDEDDDDYVARNGLSSRKRMHDARRITDNNERERDGENRDPGLGIPHAQLLQLLFGQLRNVGIVPNFE